MIFQDFHDVSNSRSLLTDGDIDTVKSLGVITGWVVESSLLINNGINSNSSLSGLSISNNKLSLTSSNWDL